MGYTTEFIGKFTFNREPSQELKDYINCFAKTRHVKSDDRLDMTGFYQRNGIVDDNYPPESQPSLWCHWIINKHGISLEQALQRFIVWCVEEPEKFTFWHKNAMAKSDDYDK